MPIFQIRCFCCCLSWLALGTVLGADVLVTPSSLNGWMPANVRADASVAITATRPRSGTGSLEFQTLTVTPGQDKADFEMTWTPDPARTLATLDALCYEYYRDSSSTTGANFHPVLRLYFYDENGTPGNTGDDILGLFIFEEVYQAGGSVPLDTWDFNDIISGRFWIFLSVNAGGTGVIQNYGLTLSDWLNNLDPDTGMPPVGQPGDPAPPTFSASTFIVGINVGVGSGWNDNFLGFADNITLGFSGGSDTFRFELDVPVELMRFSIE